MRCLVALLYVCATAYSQKNDLRQQLRSAVAEQERGDLATAIRDYEQILKARPDLTGARTNLAAALAASGRFDEAIAAYRTARGQKPGDRDIRKNLGLALYSKGDLEAAAVELRAVAAGDARVTIVLAECDLRSGRTAQALALLDNLPAGAGAFGEASYLRGMALIRTGKAEAGVAFVEQYALQTNNADALLLAGATQLNLGRIADARRTLDQLVAQHGELPGALSWAALAHDRAGDEEGAKMLFQRALKADPDDFDANLHLGAVLFRQRDYSAAQPPIDKALSLHPESPMAQYAHALLESAQGQTAKAVEDLERIARASAEWIEPHVKLSALYFKLRRDADGERERAIVERLKADRTGRSSPFETQ